MSTRTPTRSSAPRTPAQAGSNSAKRRRVNDRIPRQVAAHQELRSAAKERHFNGSDEMPVGEDGGASSRSGGKGGPGASGRRSTGKKRATNRVATPSGMLRQLANDLPPPTPDEADEVEEVETSFANKSPAAPKSVASPASAARSHASPARSDLSSPNKRTRDPLRSDDDVFSQLVPSRPFANGSPSAQASLSNNSIFNDPSASFDASAIEDPFERAVEEQHAASQKAARLSTQGKRPTPRIDLFDLPIHKNGRPSTASVGSEVESQVGRNRLSGAGRSSVGSALGARATEDDLTGDISAATGGRQSGRFLPEDNRVFVDGSSPPKARLNGHSSPLHPLPTFSSLSSPAAEEPEEADLDVDVPQEDEYGLLDEEAITGALGRRPTGPPPRATPSEGGGGHRRAASAGSVEAEMDMELETDEEDSTAPSSTEQPEARKRKEVERPPSKATMEVSTEEEDVMPIDDQQDGGEDLDGVALGVPDDDSLDALASGAGARDTSPAEGDELTAEARLVAQKEPRQRLSVAPRSDEVEEQAEDIDGVAVEDEVDAEEPLDDVGTTPKAKPPKAGSSRPTRTTATKRRKRPQRYTQSGIPIPELPRGLVKDLFTHFAGKETKLAPDGLDGLMDVSHDFFASFMADCAQISGTGRVTEADAVTVLRQMGLVNEKVTPQSLGRKFGLPRELQMVLDGISGDQLSGSGSRRRASGTMSGKGIGKGKGKRKTVETDEGQEDE